MDGQWFLVFSLGLASGAPAHAKTPRPESVESGSGTGLKLRRLVLFAWGLRSGESRPHTSGMFFHWVKNVFNLIMILVGFKGNLSLEEEPLFSQAA